MISEELVRNLIEDRIAGTTCFLVDLKIDHVNNIIVEIDNEAGTSIKDCVNVSRAIEGNLDREEQDFSLQVTSPGADKPFKVWRQYKKSIGRQLEIVLIDGKTIQVKLLSVEDDKIIVETVAVKKKDAIEKMEINKDQIKQTKIILSFK
jgi:ribosome maturation factor RimP